MIIVVLCLSVFSLLLLRSTQPVNAAPTPEMYFTFSSGTITGYDGVNGPKNVVIPDTIGGVPVTTIAEPVYNPGLGDLEGSFYNKGLTSVTIGDTVTLIDENAFGSNPITSVTIGTPSYVGAPTLAIGYGNFNGSGWNPGLGEYGRELTSLYLGPVVKSIEASFDYTSLPVLNLPSTIETIYNSFNYGIFSELTMGASSTVISYSFGDNDELTNVEIDTVESMNFTFSYVPMLATVDINEFTGNVTTLIDGNGGWALADVAPSLTVDIGIIRGDATNVVEDTPNITSMKVGTVEGEVSYLVVGWFQNTIADTVESLVVEVDTVLGSIDGFVQFSPQLTSVIIGNVVGDAEMIVQHDEDWMVGDVSEGVDIQIGTVGGYLESVAFDAVNIRTIDIDAVSEHVYGLIWGDDAWTLTDVISTLDVNIGTIGGDADYIVEAIPYLRSLVVGSIGGVINTLVIGDSGWTSSSAIPFDVTVESMTGSLDSYVIDDSPTVRSFTLGKSGALITTPLHFELSSFEDSRSLEYLNLYATTVTIEDGTFADMLIKEIRLGGVAPLIEAVFEGNNTRTGEYIRVFTTDLTNPNNYQDTYLHAPLDISDVTLAYIVNPTTVSIEYVDAITDAALAPATSPTNFSAGFSDYLIANNPVTDINLLGEVYGAYYRVGQPVTTSIPSFSGYISPTSSAFTLAPVLNNVLSLAYQPIAGPAVPGAPFTPGAPNTGVSQSVIGQGGTLIVVAVWITTVLIVTFGWVALERKLF